VPFLIVAAQISDSMQSTKESALTLMVQSLAKVINGIDADGAITDGGTIRDNRGAIPELGGHHGHP
jgi:hypothetical protein